VTCLVTLSNSGNVGLTDATITSPTVPATVSTACPAVTLEPAETAAACTVNVAATPDDFEQGGMWFNVTAEATSRADTPAAGAVMAHAEHYQTLTQLRKLTASFVAEPPSVSSAGVLG
jgi:hypothetical protein